MWDFRFFWFWSYKICCTCCGRLYLGIWLVSTYSSFLKKRCKDLHLVVTTPFLGNLSKVLNCCFTTISDHFFANCMLTFHKTEIQMVILRCLMGLKQLLFKHELSNIAKGQLIWKAFFGFFNSSKKQTKHFCPSRLGQKLKFSS